MATKKKAKKKSGTAQQPDPTQMAQPDPTQMAQPMAQPMPGMMPQQQMPMPGMQQQMPQQQMPQQQMNPMAMMQMMMQMAGGGMQGMQADPASAPFQAGAQTEPDDDPGLDSGVIRPATLEDLVKTQEALKMGNILDFLCLTEDGKNALGGLPMGCTMALAGPPGKGKTRTALGALCRIAATGKKCAFVVAEEGFHNDVDSGRDDLASRLAKIGMQVTGLSESDFREKVLENIYVMESQYHRGQTWDDFVTKYRYLVEKEEIEFVIVDSLNMLDPSRNHTADNLAALKTYNHEQGVTCLCIGQIKDTGGPVGGEALQHTADAVFLIEEMGLGSKEIAAKWGGNYRDKIDVVRATKSVTTPIFSHPIRISLSTGELLVHDDQPDEYKVLGIKD